MNPSRMQDMRPISLCSVQYKIISKILCNRLKVILPEIVSETQGAFVSGRIISDNILIAHEMIHGLRTNTKVAEGWMAIKTDMSKAYDRVEWNFLEVLLERMGFDRIWVRWIMACVTSVSFSVLLNGNSHGHFKPERGIRQGDPLSPFLFILCAEALVSCLNSAEAAGRLHGIKLTEHCPSIHHLLFADDSLLLCKANVEEAQEILNCIRLYGDASGQRVNQMKSSVIFGSLVPEVTKIEIKEVLGIEAEGGEGSYLGLPECFSGSKRKLLSFIREKLHGRLQGWFSKSLSQGGKEIMLKSVAMALPVFAMFCFKLPKDVCEKLTSAMVEFWWSSGNNRKKISWIAWKKLCTEKELGGLGFKDIEKFNQSLLAKQAWRIWSSPNSLLARLLKHRYFHRSEFLESSIGTRPSYAWRSIIHGRELLQEGLLKKVGNGRLTKVWTDNWLFDLSPRPPRYRQDAVVDLTLTVDELLDHHTNSWKVDLVRELFVDDDVDLVLKTKVATSREDTTVWGLSKSGRYDSRSGYKFLESLTNIKTGVQITLPPIEKQLWSRLWKTKTSPKLRHFLWRVLSGALAVKDQLRTRGIPVDPTCPVCHQGPETICHMLFHCPVAKEAWEMSQFPIPQAGWSNNSVFLNMHHLISCSQRQNLGASVRLSFPWLLWHIWKSRNGLCFEQIQPRASEVVRKAKEEATIWLNLQGNLPVSKENASATPAPSINWVKPPPTFLKCNIGSSWDASSQVSGAGWIIRNSRGQVLQHSRRAFTGVLSKLQAALLAASWATAAVIDLKHKNVVFEVSSPEAATALASPLEFPTSYSLSYAVLTNIHSVSKSELQLAHDSCNMAASAIADSVTRDQRSQSYIATGGPRWLSQLLAKEAAL